MLFLSNKKGAVLAAPFYVNVLILSLCCYLLCCRWIGPWLWLRKIPKAFTIRSEFYIIYVSGGEIFD